MAKTKDNKIAGMKHDELVKKLAELRENIRTLSFKAEGSKSKNVKEMSALKKNVARVLTEMNKHNKNK